MTNNLPFIGAAVLLTLAVLTWLLYPLLKAGRGGARATASRRALNAAIYRDQLAELERDRAIGNLAESDYAQARDELQRRLLQDVGATTATAATEAADMARPALRSSLALVMLLPLSAALLYAWLGNPAALQAAARPQVSSAQIDDMVAKLAARMEQNPDDLKGWTMLARSYKVLRRFDEGNKAYENVMRLGGDKNADLLTDYADLLAARAGGNLEGKPLELVNRALQLDPAHTMALALAGTAAYNRNDLAAASQHWEALLKQLPPESEDARSLSTTLAEIREKLGVAATPAKAAAQGAAAAGKSVSGKVTLAPELVGKVQPNDTLFVYARAVDGPRMPLAILRVRAADLPLSFTLDDKLAMSPQATISGAKQLKVEARISKSGNAMPQPGDLSGESATLAPGARDVQVQIGKVVP